MRGKSSKLGGGIADRLGTIVLDEALRPVTVREGEKVTEIPAIQALLRTMFRAAAQGDTKAGRQLLEVLGRAESGRASEAVQVLQTAVQYKERYGPIFERHEREGLDPPDIFPHPDDIVIEEATGEVIIDGPTTKDKAGAQTAIRDRALDSIQRFSEVKALLGSDPKNRVLKREFAELKKYQDFLEVESKRWARHEALRQARLTLEADESNADNDAD